MKVQPIRDPIMIDRFKHVLRQFSYRDWFFFVFGINVGLRVSDLVPLTVYQVRDRTHLLLKERKTGKSKRFRLNEELAAIIEDYTRYMQPDDYLFRCLRSNKVICRGQVYHMLRDAAAILDFKQIGTHTLRKTFGYHFYQKYKDVALLMEIFNHSDQHYTLGYIGILDDMIDDAVDDFHL